MWHIWDNTWEHGSADEWQWVESGGKARNLSDGGSFRMQKDSCVGISKSNGTMKNESYTKIKGTTLVSVGGFKKKLQMENCSSRRNILRKDQGIWVIPQLLLSPTLSHSGKTTKGLLF